MVFGSRVLRLSVGKKGIETLANHRTIWHLVWRRVVLKVVYIAGAGRNGSTLLEAILSELPGVVSVGELCTVWGWDEMQFVICNCGLPASECPFWSGIFANTFERLKISWSVARSIHNAEGRFRNARKSINRYDNRIKGSPYQELISTIYEEVLAATDANIVVDSSKSPTVLALLANMQPDIELKILHLVRDPRATAFAWKKRIYDERMPSGQLMRFSTTRTTVSWLAINHEIARVGLDSEGYMILRYEDFIGEPRKTLQRVCDLIGVDSSALTFVGERIIELSERHVLMGNPSRSRLGKIELRLDDDWEASMSKTVQRLIMAATWPMRGKLGYN
jgi:hypothetical protein